MNRFRWSGWLLATAACVNWVLPGPALHAAPPTARTQAAPLAGVEKIVDLALDGQGQLAGEVLDVTGRPVPGQLVVVQNVTGNQRHETRTDSQGRFTVGGLGGGLCQLTASGTSVLCRCWTSAAAPPAATERVLLVAHDGVERGQKPIGDLFLSHPVLLGLIIAAAIAIPIAVHNSRDDDSAS